jgi:hypothetical protein
MPMDRRRTESVYLLPYPLTKARHGAWWAAALDQALSNHGECYWRLELQLDPREWEEAVADAVPPPDWRPGIQMQRFTTESWPLQSGSVLTFQGIEGAVIELYADDGRVFFGLDVAFFDRGRNWKDTAARDLLLSLFTHGTPNAAPAKTESVVDADADRRARGEALLELLRKR